MFCNETKIYAKALTGGDFTFKILIDEFMVKKRRNVLFIINR